MEKFRIRRTVLGAQAQPSEAQASRGEGAVRGCQHRATLEGPEALHRDPQPSQGAWLPLEEPPSPETGTLNNRVLSHVRLLRHREL